MKKNWQVVLLHIGLQIIIGGLFVLGGFQNTGKFDANLIITYFFTAVGITLTSFLSLLFVNKHYRRVLRLSTFISVGIWFLGPLLIAACANLYEQMEQRFYEKAKYDQLREEVLKLPGQVGISSYTWDPTINQCRMTVRDGAIHTFSFLDGDLLVACQVRHPAVTDTLAWLKLSLDIASVYLDPAAYQVLDSCVEARCYDFYFSKDPLIVGIELFPKSSEDGEIGIRANLWDQWYGNFCVRLKYGKQIKNRPDQIAM